MGVILDTSILISFEKSGSAIDKFTAGREAEPFGISVVSVSELLHGVHRADSEARRVKRESYVERIIELFPIYPFDLAASLWFLRRDLATVALAHRDTVLASRACDSFTSLIGYVDLVARSEKAQFCPPSAVN